MTKLGVSDLFDIICFFHVPIQQFSSKTRSYAPIRGSETLIMQKIAAKGGRT